MGKNKKISNKFIYYLLYMKITIIKNKNKLIDNPRRLIAKIFAFNKIILFLENNNEFLDLWITNKFFARKK